MQSIHNYLTWSWVFNGLRGLYLANPQVLQFHCMEESFSKNTLCDHVFPMVKKLFLNINITFQEDNTIIIPSKMVTTKNIFKNYSKKH